MAPTLRLCFGVYALAVQSLVILVREPHTHLEILLVCFAAPLVAVGVDVAAAVSFFAAVIVVGCCCGSRGGRLITLALADV